MKRLRVGFLTVLMLAGTAYADPSVEDPSLSIDLVVSGIEAPTTMAFIGDDDFLILEKNNGRVQRVTNGTLAPAAVLDLAVNACDERGLLGIAVHPDFAAMDPKPWVYLYYTQSGGASDVNDCNPDPSYTNQLDRFEWNGSQLVNGVNLHSFPSFVSYHNGGPLSFGPDGKLYGVNGDGEQSGPAQNELGGIFDDTGVIFRLNDDGSIPDDNPFDDDDDQADPEDRYFAYGVRNSFGLGWDPVSGDLWDTENGDSSFDEINRVIRGANSGWRDIMGPGPAPAGLVDLPGSTYIEPAYSIQSPVAVTGIAFASMNSTLGAYLGTLFVADFNEGQIYNFQLNAMRTGLAAVDKLANNQPELDGFRFASGFGGVTDLEEGPDGDLYAVDILAGEVWRITGGGPQTHDFSVLKLKPPKKVTFKPDPPQAKPVKVSIQNQGSATETIANLGELDDLLDVTIGSLGMCAAPDYTVLPPKKGFPVVVEPRKKLTVEFAVDWQCINDPAATRKDEGHDDYTLDVHVDLGALGPADEDGSDDDCPRAPAVDDKGCGKTGGAPFRVDLILK